MKFSTLLLDLPFPQSTLSKIFQQHHEMFLGRFPGWSLLATRRKLVGAYWLKILANHFLVLMLLASFPVFLLYKGQHPGQLLIVFFPASIIVFSVLFLSMYWPHYHLEFLPHLDNCVESYKAQKVEGIQQCKKEQYSVVTLVLIQQTYQQLAGMGPGLIDTSIAKLLARQYGVSVKSITPALQLVVRGDWNRKSVRKRTEILHDFEDAREYFRQLSCDEAMDLLDRLQHKVLQPPFR